MPKRLLLVDDEPSIIKGLKFSLEQDGYVTEVAYDGEEALAKFAQGDFDLILLDVMLPKKDGIEVCQQIRETSQVPIIMLTAKGEDMDKILGLEYGADDYMTKPFNILEVKARIKTILRRVTAPQQVKERQIAVYGNLTVNFDARAVYVDGRDANLTAREFDILQLLINNPGKVFDREQLRDLLWREDYTGDLRTVDVHIRRLREKIEKNPSHPEYILTKWSVGYYFADQ